MVQLEAGLSKGEIDRLGEKVRQQNISVDEATLLELQAYRISHKDALSNTFNILCQLSKKVHSTAIVTYRIKRYGSIISKLERYPEMRFSRMWDIAGCRCIIQNEKEVYRLKALIYSNSHLQVVKEYDYIKEPQTDGYRSLHLFVKHACSNNVIELQLRSQKNHNWATLVEISDLLFDSRLKEHSEHKDLLRFHQLLSILDELSISDKYEISKILKKYNYFEKLSEVFSRNYLKVRKQWFALESKYNHRYFMIEATKEDVPKIKSFSNYQEAEESYFNAYKNAQGANIVLTHLQNPDYNQISIAYSNYILTFHTFLSECLQILESLITESLKKRKYYAFYNVYSVYSNLVYYHIKNLISEVNEIQNFPEYKEKSSKKSARNKKGVEWEVDINKQIHKINQQAEKLRTALKQSMPTTGHSSLIFRILIKIVGKSYQKRIKDLGAIKT